MTSGTPQMGGDMLDPRSQDPRSQDPRSQDPRSQAFTDRLGTFLLERGILDRSAVSRAKSAQAKTKERFDLVLTRLGLIQEAGIAKMLAEFLSLGFVDSADLPDRPVLENGVRPSFLKDNGILP